MDLNKSMDFYMSNLLPKRTGLPFQVWYSAKIPAHGAHRPSIEVVFSDGHKLSVDVVSHNVTGDVSLISKKDLALLFKWIDLNKDILLDYWNNAYDGKIDDFDVIQAIQKV